MPRNDFEEFDATFLKFSPTGPNGFGSLFFYEVRRNWIVYQGSKTVAEFVADAIMNFTTTNDELYEKHSELDKKQLDWKDLVDQEIITDCGPKPEDYL